MLNKNDINIRKKEQIIKVSSQLELGDMFITIYEDRNGKHVETFASSYTKETIKEVYDNFNRTLRVGETERIVKAIYKAEGVLRLRKL